MVEVRSDTEAVEIDLSNDTQKSLKEIVSEARDAIKRGKRVTLRAWDATGRGLAHQIGAFLSVGDSKLKILEKTEGENVQFLLIR